MNMLHPAALRRFRILLAALPLLILVTAVIGAGWGPSSLSYDRLLPTLLGHGTFKESFVLFSLRLPRMVITLLAGMALALSGAILQNVTRNDLADPGIIGINAGAGAAIAVFFLYVPLEPGAFTYLIPPVAFGGALLTAILIYLFAYKRHAGMQPVRLVLVGIGFSMALAGAMILLISSADRNKVDFIAKWLAGSVWGSDWPFVWAILPWLAVLIPFTLTRASRMNLLALSEPAAVGAGLQVERERLLLLLTAVALAASAVSMTGGISFIGLIAPHLAKRLAGPRNQLNLPVAIMTGGFLLLLADTVGRNVAQPAGLPVGIVAALIGAPYFIYLLMRK